MTNTTMKKHLNIRDYLLCVLPILAFVSMQWVNATLLHASLIITFFVLISIWLLSVNYFTATDFIIIVINILSLLITIAFFPGTGVALNFLNLLLCFMIFNKVGFSEKAINITRLMLIVGILSFFITSTYSIEWDWVSFYDKNGTLINNNTASLILVALYIHLSTFLLKKKKKWRYILVIGLFAFCIVSVNILGCRSAMLFFLLYSILILFRKKILKREKSVRKLCIVFLIISFCLPIVYLFLYNQIGNFEIMGKSFFSGREKVWSEAYQQIKISPLFGSGTEFVMDYGKGVTESTHNMLLGLWKNLGIIPIISVICFYALNNKPKTETNIIISIIAIIGIACFESFLMDSHLYLLFLPAFPGSTNTLSIDKK